MQTIEREIVGTLYTNFGEYSLLKLLPDFENLEFWDKQYLKQNGVLCFLVVDTSGYEKTLYLKGEWMIKPVHEHTIMDVRVKGDEMTLAEINKPLFSEEV